MIIKLRLFSWRFTFTMAPTTKILGVNSNLEDGKHIIMWDIDDLGEDAIIIELSRVQTQYHLPNIYVLNSGTPRHWLAYCFHRCDFRFAAKVVSNTNYVDWNFIKYSIYREHFTLRVGNKCGRKIKHYCTILSKVPETAIIEDLKRWCHYETVLPIYKQDRRLSINVELSGRTIS